MVVLGGGVVSYERGTPVGAHGGDVRRDRDPLRDRDEGPHLESWIWHTQDSQGQFLALTVLF